MDAATALLSEDADIDNVRLCHNRAHALISVFVKCTGSLKTLSTYALADGNCFVTKHTPLSIHYANTEETADTTIAIRRRDLPQGWRQVYLAECCLGLDEVVCANHLKRITKSEWDGFCTALVGWNAVEMAAIIELAKRLFAVATFVQLCEMPTDEPFSRLGLVRPDELRFFGDALHFVLRNGSLIRTRRVGTRLNRLVHNMPYADPTNVAYAGKGVSPVRIKERSIEPATATVWNAARELIKERIAVLNEYIRDVLLAANAYVRATHGPAAALHAQRTAAAKKAAKEAENRPPPMPTGDDAPTFEKAVNRAEWYLDKKITDGAIVLGESDDETPPASPPASKKRVAHRCKPRPARSKAGPSQ